MTVTLSCCVSCGCSGRNCFGVSWKHAAVYCTSMRVMKQYYGEIVWSRKRWLSATRRSRGPKNFSGRSIGWSVIIRIDLCRAGLLSVSRWLTGHAPDGAITRPGIFFTAGDLPSADSKTVWPIDPELDASRGCRNWISDRISYRFWWMKWTWFLGCAVLLLYCTGCHGMLPVMPRGYENLSRQSY
jgi:hypothetical protein